MSLNVKLSTPGVTSPRTTLALVSVGTALVLATYVTPMANLPYASADLGAGSAARAWILSSMSVGLAGALLVTGVLGDTFGRRRVYVAGLVALAAGAAVCAVAVGPVLLVVARVVQGVGGAAMLACGLAVLAAVFAPGPDRVHATSVWGASVGLGIAGGALLAALLDVGTGWRETYAVTAVLALVLLVPTLRSLPESAAESPRRVDVPGLVLLVAGMSLLVAALTQGRGGLDPVAVAMGVSALGSLVGFAVVQRRVLMPLVEPALLRSPRFRTATLGSLVLGVGMVGLAAYVPTYAQVALGLSLWEATWLVAIWAVMSVVAALLVRRVPHPLVGGPPVAVLLVVVALGQALALGVDAPGEVWRIGVAMAVTGLGTGVLNAVLGREAVASVPPDRAAMGSGANNTARYLGAACGITLFVTVATHAGSGPGPVAGWDVALLIAVGVTLAGAATIAAVGRPPRV